MKRLSEKASLKIRAEKWIDVFWIQYPSYRHMVKSGHPDFFSMINNHIKSNLSKAEHNKIIEQVRAAWILKHKK